MSEYRKSTTSFKDRECLVEALVANGYAREHIQIHEDAQQLFDYRGRPTHYTDKNGDKANVVVRRHHVGGAANDLGFKQEPDGAFSALISDYDTGKHNQTWLKNLKVGYAEKTLIKTGKAQGLKYLGTKVVEGKKQIQWMDTSA